jgi:glycosyltransferase involved in cell wall biosynthesis
LDEKAHSILFRHNNKQYGLFSYPFFGSDVSGIREVREAEIIYLHWFLKGFLNFRSLEQLAKLNKPLIFFMHDMWSITGGCHNSFQCTKYESRCNNCQMFPKQRSNDWSAKEFDRKQKLYSRYDNLIFVSPSRWLYECSRKSALTKEKPLYCIPNILDRSVFKNFDRKVARQILNLDPDEKILAFGAVTINSPYKGWDYLKNALKIFSTFKHKDNITFLVFGGKLPSEEVSQVPFKTKYLGFLRDEFSTALVYNAADVFIAPSLADNLPTTVLQSLGCGTPVVGFNVGGIPDMIKHKQNGYLAEHRNSMDLAVGIDYCLNNDINGWLSKEFEKDNIMRKHMEMIEEIIT